MLEDFVTWPLFVSLLLAACSMVLGRLYFPKFFYNVSKILILLVCVGILISLYHDSTQVLNFYF